MCTLLKNMTQFKNLMDIFQIIILEKIIVLNLFHQKLSFPLQETFYIQKFGLQKSLTKTS